MSSEITDFIRSDEFLLNSAEFEIFLLSLELDQFESSFDIIKNSVGFVEFWNVNDVHKTTWILGISSDFFINDKKTLFLMKDGVDFSGIEGNS